MLSNDEIQSRIKTCIINSLELEITPEDIPNEMQLFGKAENEKSMELDSLAALEIAVALSIEFDITITDMEPEVFTNITTLASYVTAQMQEFSSQD